MRTEVEIYFLCLTRLHISKFPFFIIFILVYCKFPWFESLWSIWLCRYCLLLYPAVLIGCSPSKLFLQLNDYEIRNGKKIGVTVSFNNHRLFVGNIPKNRDRDDLFEEFSRHARKSLRKVFAYWFYRQFKFGCQLIDWIINFNHTKAHDMIIMYPLLINI